MNKTYTLTEAEAKFVARELKATLNDYESMMDQNSIRAMCIILSKLPGVAISYNADIATKVIEGK